MDFSALDPAVAAELEAAIEKVEAELENTVVDNESLDAAKEEFYAARAKARGEVYPQENDDTIYVILAKVCKLASDLTYRFFGPRGWSDPLF